MDLIRVKNSGLAKLNMWNYIKIFIKGILPICQLNDRYAFSTGIGSVFFNPFYFARKALKNNISELGQHLSGKILDVGCGTQPYKHLLHYTEYKGMEYDTPDNRKYKNADFFYDGAHFPLQDKSFDSVLCTQVLEHVFDPELFISELSRVIKPGGKILLTVPFVWDEHEQPYDFARYSSFALKYLLEKNKFEFIEHRKTCNDITALCQLLNCYLYKKIIGRGGIARLLVINILTAIVNLNGLFLNLFLPRNDDFYLDNIILAVKTENSK